MSEYWTGHEKDTLKSRKIKKHLEELGHTNVHVWWEPVRNGPEMCGPEGGWFFASDQRTIEPIGYSYNQAFEYLDMPWFRVVTREAAEAARRRNNADNTSA